MGLESAPQEGTLSSRDTSEGGEAADLPGGEVSVHRTKTFASSQPPGKRGQQKMWQGLFSLS